MGDYMGEEGSKQCNGSLKTYDIESSTEREMPPTHHKESSVFNKDYQGDLSKLFNVAYKGNMFKTLDMLRKGYEVLHLTEAVVEYTTSAPQVLKGKRFLNVAKEDFNIDGDTAAAKACNEVVQEKYDPLLKC
jgi:HSP90 family molecular chaperone